MVSNTMIAVTTLEFADLLKYYLLLGRDTFTEYPIVLFSYLSVYTFACLGRFLHPNAQYILQ